MTKSNVFASLALGLAMMPLGCGSADTTGGNEKTATASAALTTGGPYLLWQELHTGNLAAWVTSGINVTGTQPLVGETCAPGSSPGTNCNLASVGTLGNSVMWLDQVSGAVEDWTFDNNGVTTSLNLQRTCGDGGPGCHFAPLGQVAWTIEAPPGGLAMQGNGLLWFDPSTGKILRWNINSDGSVTSTSDALTQTCPAPGCFPDWEPTLTADFNGDGTTDLLLWNKRTGQLLVWELEADGVTVRDDKLIGDTCTTACAEQFTLIGVADVNGDKHADLTWRDANTGNIETWLLDGSYNHVGTTPPLSWTCPEDCWSQFKPLGYVAFPFIAPIPK
jgi:hypothetical protein